MEELRKMWDRQSSFQSLVAGKLPATSEDRIKEFSLCMFSEIGDLLNSVNWRSHRELPDKTIVTDNVLEELIDIWKYTLSLAIDWNITPEQFMDAFDRKSEVVEQRYIQENWWRRIDKPIVGLDLDGVMANYTKGLIEYINKELHNDFDTSVVYYRIEDHLSGVSKEVFNKLLDGFRTTGQKRYLDIFPGAKRFVQLLRHNGYSVILLTARPYKIYKRMFSDTIYWLKKNNIEYDAILFNDDKGNTLINTFGAEKIRFFVEDNLRQANAISKKDVKVYMLNKTYNQGELDKNVIRVDYFGDILKREGI
jgi:uncharacterized HAD superfamily protein